MAVGPDGAFYICNNGGFGWRLEHGLLRPVVQASDYASGRIERVDPATGKVEVLYDSCNGHKLRGPNDVVFDAHGGCYFSDLGKSRARDRDHGGLYYALADGSKIVEVAYPILTPNGVGLSPDGSVVYVAETETARLWAFDVVVPGVVRKRPFPSPHGGRLVAGLGGYQRFDSLAVDALGNICVATLDHRRGHLDRTGWADRAAGEDAGPGDHQHLLRRRRPAHRLRYAVRHGEAGRAGMAGGGAEAAPQRLISAVCGPAQINTLQ